MKKVTEVVRELALPVVEENGCKLWDVEYVREAGQWYLRLYIDKDGGVNILDCEAISRAMSDILDEADPIESSYIFEVASAGAERPLKRPSDFEQFMGSPVLICVRDQVEEQPGVGILGVPDEHLIGLRTIIDSFNEVHQAPIQVARRIRIGFVP